MGSLLSPVIANLFIKSLEQQLALSECELKLRSGYST